jgi:hypothetical protein
MTNDPTDDPIRADDAVVSVGAGLHDGGVVSFESNVALWHVTHADGRSAVVRAASGPLAMNMLRWRSASFDMLTAAGGAEIVMQAPARHNCRQHIEVLDGAVEWDVQP